MVSKFPILSLSLPIHTFFSLEIHSPPIYPSWSSLPVNRWKRELFKELVGSPSFPFSLSFLPYLLFSATLQLIHSLLIYLSRSSWYSNYFFFSLSTLSSFYHRCLSFASSPTLAVRFPFIHCIRFVLFISQLFSLSSWSSSLLQYLNPQLLPSCHECIACYHLTLAVQFPIASPSTHTLDSNSSAALFQNYQPLLISTSPWRPYEIISTY